MRQKYIHIVLTRTKTKPAQMIRLITRKPYSHVSLSSDVTLGRMYSFCRDYKSTPFPAHFNTETIDTQVFGAHDEIPCEVYRLPVTDEQFVKFEEHIRHFVINRTRYTYNIAAFLPMFLHIPYKFKNRFVCSVWAAYILDQIGVEHGISKDTSLIEPDDLRYIPSAELVFKGNLKEYTKYMSIREKYEKLQSMPLFSQQSMSL